MANKVSKISLSELKTADVAYLFRDGHIVIIHTKSDKDVGYVEWVTIHEHTGIVYYMGNRHGQDGCLCINGSFLPMLMLCDYVNVFFNDDDGTADSFNLAVKKTGKTCNIDATKYGGPIQWNEGHEKFSDVSGNYDWGPRRLKVSKCNFVE